MAEAKPQLILYGKDRDFLAALGVAFAPLPYISCKCGTSSQVKLDANLDAIWATPMSGLEVFGLIPPFPLHKAVVAQTPQAKQDQGFPRYGVIGVATSQGDPQTPEFDLRLIVSALLNAVMEFNIRNDDRILRIGVLADHLRLKELDPLAALQIIREVYEGRPRA